jgi:hypothetical protein
MSAPGGIPLGGPIGVCPEQSVSLDQPLQHVGAGIGAKMPGNGRVQRPGRVQQLQARMASGGLQAHREVGRGDVGCSCRRQQRPARPAAQQPTSVLGNPEDADHCQRPAPAPPRLTNSDGQPPPDAQRLQCPSFALVRAFLLTSLHLPSGRTRGDPGTRDPAICPRAPPAAAQSRTSEACDAGHPGWATATTPDGAWNEPSRPLSGQRHTLTMEERR